MDRYFVMLVGCLVGGCAPITGPPTVPAAGTQFDGSYTGQDTLLAGVAFQCGDPTLPVRIEVRDGQFAYPFQVSPPRVAPLPVRIAADGTLGGQMQVRHRRGPAGAFELRRGLGDLARTDRWTNA